MASPNPVPPNLLAVLDSACSNAVKIRSKLFSLIPIPVSSTLNRMVAASSSCISCCTAIVILPRSGVNFKAFPMIFISTWFRRSSSPIRCKSVYDLFTTKLISLFSACGDMSTTISLTNLSRSNASWHTLILPLSIRDISRISLIKDKRYCVEVSIFARHSDTFFSSPTTLCAILVIPTIAFIGVRISWDIRDKNSVFALLAISALAFVMCVDIIFETSFNFVRTSLGHTSNGSECSNTTAPLNSPSS